MSDSSLVKTDPLSEAREFYRKVIKEKLWGLVLTIWVLIFQNRTVWRLVLVFQHDDKIVIFSLAQSRHCHSSSIASFRRYSVIRLGGFVMSKKSRRNSTSLLWQWWSPWKYWSDGGEVDKSWRWSCIKSGYYKRGGRRVPTWITYSIDSCCCCCFFDASTWTCFFWWPPWWFS